MITCADGLAIHSWLLYHPTSSLSSSSSQRRQPQRPTIIWFHGNAGNIGLRLPQAIQMYNALHVNVWMIEYRGFGDSQDPSSSSAGGGKINEAGIKLDAEAVWDYVNNKYHPPRTQTTTSSSSSSSSRVTNNNNDDRIISSNVLDPKKMFVFGQSLGGAVAFHLAQYAQQKQLLSSTSTATAKVVSSINCYAPLAGIIVENTFLSISEMVDHLLPYVISPIKYLILRMYWDSGTIVRHLHTTPALFIAGAQDTLVPHVHMLHLYGRMKSSVQSASVSSSSSSSSSIATKVNTDLVRLHIVKDGTHNDTWMKGGREYWTTISRFMNDALFVLDNSNSGSSSSSSSSSSSDGNSASSSAGSSHDASTTNIAATARAPPPLFQRKSSINGGISSSTNRGECLGSSSIEVDSGGGGEDSVELISGVANFLGMASNVLKKGSTTSGEAKAYKKKD
jgi:pimeloyl-ACP methyl ester carboxylesterase